MPSPDSKTRARAELVDLIESQLNTLEKETFGCVTERQNSANTRTGATASVSSTLNLSTEKPPRSLLRLLGGNQEMTTFLILALCVVALRCGRAAKC
jgi:hypothetical protein